MPFAPPPYVAPRGLANPHLQTILPSLFRRVDGGPYRRERIETPEGKQEYAAAQRVFAQRGVPLRARLLDACGRLRDTRAVPR